MLLDKWAKKAKTALARIRKGEAEIAKHQTEIERLTSVQDRLWVRKQANQALRMMSKEELSEFELRFKQVGDFRKAQDPDCCFTKDEFLLCLAAWNVFHTKAKFTTRKFWQYVEEFGPATSLEHASIRNGRTLDIYRIRRVLSGGGTSPPH
jgi:hypothetical protein